MPGSLSLEMTQSTASGVERVLPYRAEQLFELAADVERYPEFVPGWQEARVRDRTGQGYFTRQVIGIGPFHLAFDTRTTLHRPERIDIGSTDPRFRRFSLQWTFASVPPDSCRVGVSAAVELRAPLLQRTVTRVLSQMASAIIQAFELRARELYGTSGPRI